MYKSKSMYRAESKEALEAFLRAGGVIEVVKPSKRGAKAVRMAAKTTRSFAKGSNGKPMGYTRSSMG